MYQLIKILQGTIKSNQEVSSQHFLSYLGFRPSHLNKWKELLEELITDDKLEFSIIELNSMKPPTLRGLVFSSSSIVGRGVIRSASYSIAHSCSLTQQEMPSSNSVKLSYSFFYTRLGVPTSSISLTSSGINTYLTKPHRGQIINFYPLKSR